MAARQPAQRRDDEPAFVLHAYPYRETSHQLALTRALDLAAIRASGLPCFGSLERGLRVVLTATEPVVYPPAP